MDAAYTLNRMVHALRRAAVGWYGNAACVVQMLSLLLCFLLPSAFGAGAEAPLRTYPQHRRQHAAALMRNWIAQGHHYQKNGDIYQFGVFTGRGLREWPIQFAGNLSFRHQWGFDSFTGMPVLSEAQLDAEGESIAQFARLDTGPGGLRAGELDTRESFRSKRWEDIEASILAYVKHNATTLIRGYFNESLPALHQSTLQQMRPATLLDFDGDLYVSTREPYDWLFRNKLVAAGTFVFYDDLQKCKIPHARFGGNICGEAKAHQEITALYGVRWHRLEYNLYQVKSIG